MKSHIGPLQSHGVELRLLEFGDLATTLAWRNRDDVRIWFKMSDVIDEEHHRRWFESYLGKDNDYVFVVLAEARPVGQVAIYAIDTETGSAEIGRFIAAPGEGGKGYMAAAISALIDLAIGQFRLSHIYLEVFAHNKRAIGLYKKLGFTEDGRIDDMLRFSVNSQK